MPVLEKELTFNYDAINNLKQVIIAHDVAWEKYFEMCQVKPLVIVYEELALDYEETAREVLRYLGIPVPLNLEFAARKMKRQSDALTKTWVQAYYQHEKQFHKPPPVARYPDNMQ